MSEIVINGVVHLLIGTPPNERLVPVSPPEPPRVFAAPPSPPPRKLSIMDAVRTVVNEHERVKDIKALPLVRLLVPEATDEQIYSAARQLQVKHEIAIFPPRTRSDQDWSKTPTFKFDGEPTPRGTRAHGRTYAPRKLKITPDVHAYMISGDPRPISELREHINSLQARTGRDRINISHLRVVPNLIFDDVAGTVMYVKPD